LQPPSKTLVSDARAAVAACAGWNSRLAARRITKFLDARKLLLQKEEPGNN
jgi:hypothetical protein